MEVKESLHIFRASDGEYLVAKIMECNKVITNKIVARFGLLMEAQKYIDEDAVPGNAVSAGNVSPGDGEEPPAPMAGQYNKKRRKRNLKALFRRIAPMLNINLS